MKRKYAPIALFVYNRPDTLKKMLSSLVKNKLIKNADIYIFSDGPKKKEDSQKIKKVREIINNIKKLRIKKKFYFKKNRGLKKNILGGVSYVLKKNSKIIVIEDDLLLSPYFYQYMNNALDFIEKKKNIWHVSAWNYPLKVTRSSKNSTFLWNNMNCWGWGTHKKYWRKIILNSDFFIKKFSKKNINRFDMNGYLNNWNQIKKNNKNIISSWAIFWNASIFLKKGLCLNPVVSFSKNIGFSEDSTNTRESIPQTSHLNQSKNIIFPEVEKINPFYVTKIKAHLNLNKKIKKYSILKKRIYEIFK